MSKRAEEAVLELFPVEMALVPLPDGDTAEEDVNRWKRKFAKIGYEQAEKDTLDRVCKWLEENATYTHPRKGIKTCIINLNALREAMEEE